MAMNPQYKDMLIRLLIEMYQQPEDEPQAPARPQEPILTKSTIQPVGG